MAHFCPLRVNSHFISNLLRLLFDEAKWKCGNMRAKEEKCVHIAIATSNRNQTNNTHTHALIHIPYWMAQMFIIRFIFRFCPYFFSLSLFWFRLFIVTLLLVMQLPLTGSRLIFLFFSLVSLHFYVVEWDDPIHMRGSNESNVRTCVWNQFNK